MMALDAKTGEKKYSVKANGYLYSSHAISGHTAFYGDFTGNFYALDLNSRGKSLQTFSTESRNLNASGILNKNGDLDFTHAAGKEDLTFYSSSVKVMNIFYTMGSIVSSPSISGNTVYFGSADGFLYALGLTN
jgi:outer membrane protein assembly factor BamB